MKHLPKLTMRDLLWLIAVVALAVLWWMERKEVINLRTKVQSSQMRQAELEAENVQLQKNLMERAITY